MCPGSSCQTVTCLTDEWAALLTAAPSGAGVHEGTSATMEPWHQLGLGLREGSSEYQEIGRGLRPQPPSPLASPSCTRSVLPSRRTEPPRIPLPALLFSWALALHALWAGLSWQGITGSGATLCLCFHNSVEGLGPQCPLPGQHCWARGRPLPSIGVLTIDPVCLLPAGLPPPPGLHCGMDLDLDPDPDPDPGRPHPRGQPGANVSPPGTLPARSHWRDVPDLPTET